MPRHWGQHVFGDFSGWSKAKARLDRRINAKRRKPMEPWRFHSSRTTFDTIMNNRGLAQPHIIDELLAHVGSAKEGVAGVYNKATYDAQGREAMQAWGKLVAGLTS